MKTLLIWIGLLMSPLYAEVQTKGSISIDYTRRANGAGDIVTIYIKANYNPYAFVVSLGSKPFVVGETKTNYQQKIVKRRDRPTGNWTEVEFRVGKKERIDYLFVNELNPVGDSQSFDLPSGP